MPEERRCGYRRSERSQICENVVDGSDELPVGHMCDGNDQAARKGDGQEEVDHAAKYRVNSQLAETNRCLSMAAG
jgi:hypothetical protein